MIDNKYTHRLKVLNVDTSPLVAYRIDFLLSDLERVDFCGTAMNIDSALQKVQSEKPDVVIMDFQLKNEGGEMNGMELLTALRQSYPAMILMMLTNHSEPQYRYRCQLLGANYFFDKTTDFSKIPGILNNIVRAN